MILKPSMKKVEWPRRHVSWMHAAAQSCVFIWWMSDLSLVSPVSLSIIPCAFWVMMVWVDFMSNFLWLVCLGGSARMCVGSVAGCCLMSSLRSMLLLYSFHSCVASSMKGSSSCRFW